VDAYTFAFKVESYSVRKFYTLLRMHPTSEPYVSGDSFRSLARHVLDDESSFDPSKVERGDVIFVDGFDLPRFAESYLPRIREAFVLISHNDDRNIGADFLALLEDQRLIAWFAQNAVLSHPKLHPVPIGLENRRIHNNGIVRDYDRVRATPRDKKLRILYAFSLGTNPGERGPALEALRMSPLADGGLSFTVSRAYRKKLNGYAFVASPPGNGFDCHRTWEALYFGVIPIVRRSPFFEGFPGLPAILVDDWAEVSAMDEARLRAAYQELSPKIDGCPYLRMEYWKGIIDGAGRDTGSAVPAQGGA